MFPVDGQGEKQKGPDFSLPGNIPEVQITSLLILERERAWLPTSLPSEDAGNSAVFDDHIFGPKSADCLE